MNANHNLNVNNDKFNDNVEIFSRVIGTFTQTYMTLISIVQSTVVACLVFKIGQLYSSKIFMQSNDQSLFLILKIFSSCCFIFLVWNEYRIGSIMFRWIPGILDTLVPFFLIFTQYATILLIDNDKLWHL